MTGITTARYSEPWLLWMLAAYAGIRASSSPKPYVTKRPSKLTLSSPSSGSTSATNRHCRPPCHSRSLFRDRLRAGYENGTSTRYAIKQSNRADRISNAGRNETHRSSYSLPPPSTFRFDQIFQCEQFDTELSAPWGPHGSWAMRSRRVKWLLLERLRNLTKKHFISSVTRWTKLGDE